MSWYFDQPFHAVVHSPQDAPFVLSALAHLLQPRSARLTVERALKHVFVSVDEPVGNFTHVTAQDRSFRDFVRGLPRWEGRLSPHVETITTDTAHAFDFDPQEFYRRVVQVYDVDYSNFMPYAPTVKRRFLTDDPVQRKNFGHLFIAWYDRESYLDKPGARAAVEWLKSIRRYLAKHTVVGRAPPATPPSLSSLEGGLTEALARFRDELRAHLPASAHGDPLHYYADELDRLVAPPEAVHPQRREALVEVLQALLLPPPRIHFFQRIAGTRDLLARWRQSQRPEVDRAALQEATAHLRDAAGAALAWAW